MERIGELGMRIAAAITGIGQSQVGRRLGRSELDLTVEAALLAMADAGLTREEIDGLATYPGMGIGTPGFAGPPSPEVQEALRLKLSWHDGGGEGPAQMRAVIAAATAVSCGLARHVLVYRTVAESTAQGSKGRAGIGGAGLNEPENAGGDTAALPQKGSGVPRFGGFLQWYLPFGAVSPANWIALVTQRRMHEFGLTREQLAQIALNARRNAALNPNAVYRSELTLEDYLSSRMVSSPLCLYDCDAPCDGSTALIVSRVELAEDLANVPAYIESVGTALRGRPSWDQFDDMTSMAARDAAMSMWERSSLSPLDVEVAELYDGFSVLAMVWLEALGFCKRGESGDFVGDGSRIGLDGELPVNTGGGQLSGGRLHGFGLIYEAVLQIRGKAGARQVAGRSGDGPSVAVVSNGGGPLAGSMLLTRERP